VHPYSTYSRTSIKATLAARGGGAALAGKSLVVGGWVKSGREQGGGAFYFIQLNDGSIFTDLQARRPCALGAPETRDAGAPRCVPT
jgi:asparaginyl-tRNA synthetase